MDKTAAAYLKRSQFVVGLAKALRGLTGDLRVISWLAKRKLQIRKYVKLHQAKRLHLGASNNALDGWLNTDIFPNHSSIVYLDATKRFPFKDNTFDYILSEHMIEHVEYRAAIAMLRESFRTLKPGGRVRVATPDLRVLLGAALGGKNGSPKKLHRLGERTIYSWRRRVQRRFRDQQLFSALGDIVSYMTPTPCRTRSSLPVFATSNPTSLEIVTTPISKTWSLTEKSWVLRISTSSKPWSSKAARSKGPTVHSTGSLQSAEMSNNVGPEFLGVCE